MPRRIEIYDTTLRDGAQGEHVCFSLQDKIEIAHELDRLGIDYVEGGWPGSNPKDDEFFAALRGESFERAQIAAFGSTRHARNAAEDDPNLRAVAASGARTAAIFGKTWDLHVTDALRVSPEENLRMIAESAAFLGREGLRVFFDAEHFFDGYFGNREYALRALRAALDGGAKLVVLCDTNGGRQSWEIDEACREVAQVLQIPFGIHAHNDSGLAVANTLAAVRCGAVHVQGTINGLGERCGNADLASVIPNLQLKMGLECLAPGKLARLTEASRMVYEISNLNPRDNQPFVGASAFAHKGGVHVSAVGRNPATYEHIAPGAVGNERRILVSELSGRSAILEKTGRARDLTPGQMKEILDKVQELERIGYQFESADASFDLLIRRVLGGYEPFFILHGFRVVSERRDDGRNINEATIKIEVGGVMEHTAAEGDGPVNALDGALRKALEKFYPALRKVRLVDYKVRVIDAASATAASVRVVIRSTDGESFWTTVGASENIIEASWLALVDSVEYKLLRNRGEGAQDHA